MSVVPTTDVRGRSRWRAFEAWVGTRGSAAALFGVALAVFAFQSVVLPVGPGRDMGRYVQTYLQLGYHVPIVPSVLDTRGPLAALGVGVPLEVGGWAAEIWLALLFASSIVAWGYVALTFGARAALATSVLLLLYPGYGIMFHALASDSLFAAAFAGWAILLTKAMVRPSVGAFLFAGLGMGALVLVRPANQVLIVMAATPLLVRAPWRERLRRAAAFFVGAVAVAQCWPIYTTWRYGDALGLRPSSSALLLAFVLLPVIAPPRWRRLVAVVVVAGAVSMAAVIAVKGVSLRSPTYYARAVAQVPQGNVFLFRAFEMERIVSPSNGSASRKMARVVQRELLAKEPYRSYGVSIDDFFSSGSDRMFGDLTSLAGQVDLPAVTDEAIRRHPRAFLTGIASTLSDLLWTKRVYRSEPATSTSESRGGSNGGGQDLVVIDGRKLPRPTGGQPIPASRVGLEIQTLFGGAREVWRSASVHPLVFDDARDARRYAAFNDDTTRLVDRIPTRGSDAELVHRFNQTSHVFPPPAVWLALGLVGFALRRPRCALVALTLSAAALIVIVSTALIAFAVAEYAAPVSPVFILLAAAGLLAPGRNTADVTRTVPT